MIDLSAKVHYKARIEIHRNDNTSSLFSLFFDDVRKWLERKNRGQIHFWNWEQVSKYGVFKSNDERATLNSTSYYISEEQRYWAMRFSETQTFESTPSDVIETSPRIWTTEIGYEQENENVAMVSLICYYIDKAGFVGLQADPPSPTTPQIFYRFLTNPGFTCKAESSTIASREISLGNGYGEKIGREIQSDLRGLPFILLIPVANVEKDAEGSAEWTRKLAIKLAPTVLANANVYHAESSVFSEELSYFVPRELVCYPGSLCVYWPSYKDSKGRRIIKRRFFTADQISNLGQEVIVSIIRRVLSLDINYYESKEMFRCQDCDALYRSHRVSLLREKYEQSKANVSIAEETQFQLQERIQLAEELIKYADEENKELRDSLQGKEDEIKKLASDKWQLESQIEYYLPIVSSASAADRALEILREFSDYPSSPEDVAKMIMQIFPDSIDFTEQGWSSLSECDKSLTVVWQALRNAATVLRQVYADGNADIEKAFDDQVSGFTLARGHGKGTRRDTELMRNYLDIYQGKEISIEAHMRKGSRDTDQQMIRLYFCYLPETRKIVIGHIGKHLDNYTSRKIR